MKPYREVFGVSMEEERADEVRRSRYGVME